MQRTVGELIALTERLFEPLGDIVFCAKDLAGRYIAVNHAFLLRAGVDSKEALLGKLPSDVFPERLAKTYSEQDRRVLAEGRPLSDQMERITNTDGSIGWYLAHKHPLRDPSGAIVGLVGVSQDLHAPSEQALKMAPVAEVVEHIQRHLDQPLKVEDYAKHGGLSLAQLDRRMKRVFRLSTKQFIMKARLEEASRLLEASGQTIGEIALRCGFADQSAFTRHFKAATSLTPGEFRRNLARR